MVFMAVLAIRSACGVVHPTMRAWLEPRVGEAAGQCKVEWSDSGVKLGWHIYPVRPTRACTRCAVRNFLRL